MGLWNIVKLQVIAVAAEVMDFPVDQGAAIFPVVFQVILEVDDQAGH